jgi:RHS repeat-associated protein
MSARVTNANGRIISEKRNGQRRYHQHDALGNTIALIDDAGTVTNTFSYWPYGELRTPVMGNLPTPFLYCGRWGYYTDTTGRIYVRARTYRPVFTRWLTVDPLWPRESAYGYGDFAPLTFVDPSGATCMMSQSDIVVKLKTWPRCTAVCNKVWYDVSSWLCGRCDYDLNTLMEIMVDIKGCKNCALYQWVSHSGGPYRRDTGEGWPYSWDCNMVGQPRESCNTNDNPGESVNFVRCDINFAVQRDFITCVCCTGASFCFTWGTYHSAHHCEAYCDHWEPTWLSKSASSHNCKAAVK